LTVVNTEARMNPHLTSFFHFKNVFTPEECYDLIYSTRTCTQAHVASQLEGKKNNLMIYTRNTKVKSLPRYPEYQWIYDRIFEYLRLVNEKYYHFQLSSVTSFQVLEYENTGFYHTHVDVGPGPSSLRKLSNVTFLTPPEEYTGGELILKPNFAKIVPEQGSTVFFPSYVPHEIKPVTQGVRHSMVTWVIGPCYK